MKRIAFRSLGCKLNTHEEELARQALEATGRFCIVPFDEEADFYVINTCTVTAHSDRKCRGYIRQAARRNPKARILVTGCYAQVSPEALSAMPEVHVVLGNREKQDLVDYIDKLDQDLLEDRVIVGDIMAVSDLRIPLLKGFTSKSRAFVKIQDGCNNRCTYCTIPYARGRSRSCSEQDVLKQLDRLRETGAKEIVLSGVHVGQYGHDLTPKITLKILIEKALQNPNAPRLRLSSINPMMLTDELIEFMSSTTKVCRHFHVSFQSGCSRTLQRMKRPYGPSEGADRLARLIAAMPDSCIGSDVIVGFPGETEVDFEECRTWLEAQPLAYLHVFSYSIRPGTPAATMLDQVPPETKKIRSRILRELSDKKRLTFREGFLGKTREAIAIRPLGPSGEWEFLSDNYIPIHGYCQGIQAGNIVSVTFEQLEENWVTGHIHT